MKITFKHEALKYHNPETGKYDDCFSDGSIVVEGNYIVCPTCKGSGHHFRNDLDQSKLVELMEEDGDFDGIKAYYKDQYNQVCSECKGQRIISEPVLPKWAEELISKWHEAMVRYRKEFEAERRVGA